MSSIKPAQSYINEDRAKSLMEKWAPVIDYTSENVAAIENDHTRLNTAILLENQEAWCLNENTAGAGGALGTGSTAGGAMTPVGDNYAAGDQRLPKILIPMIRRTFPELITNEIVGVQPMSGPVGLAFALRYRYEKDTLGSGIDGKSEAGNSPTRPTNIADEEEVGYQYLDTRFTGTTGTFTELTDSSGPLNMPDEDTGVAALLKDYEITGNIPQMTIEFSKTAVEAGTRRLAARWSVELEQDLKNMNGIDIDTELTNAMSYEIQAEIDREMLMRMLQVAIKAGSGKGYSTWSPTSADGRWLAERNRDLYAKVIVEANRIAIRNRRGAANFIVATPGVCAVFEMLPEFQWMQVQGNVNTQPTGVARVGNLGGRFNVYRDTRTEAHANSTYPQGQTNNYNNGATSRVEYALLGYKGPEFYDTGIIYCPYIPVMVQRTIGPNDFAPRVGLLTRYGVVDNIFGADLYYHAIIVKSLAFQSQSGIVSPYS